MKWTGRLCSLLLAIMMVLTICPVTAFAATTSERHFEQLKKMAADGKYFTTGNGGTPCYENDHANHDCGASAGKAYCNVSAVCTQNWLFNYLDYKASSGSILPKQYYPSGNTGVLGDSCFGFANFAMWYIFSTTGSQNMVGLLSATSTFTKDNIAKLVQQGTLKRGYIIRIENKHSVIFDQIDASGNGIKVLDCNWNHAIVGNSKIQYHTLEYSAYAGCSIAVTKPDKEGTSTQPATYTVTYNANGGTGAPAAQTKTDGVALTLSSTIPTRNGYSFLGWATSAGATTAQYSAGGSYTANAGVTLYAVWEAWRYQVKYDANGGTGAPAAQTKTDGVALTLSSTIPTRNGYSFLGWATSAGATTAQYSAGGSYTANAGVTLYAVWEAWRYPVKYDANGGTGAPATQDKIHDKTLILSTVVPQREGYVFKGWRDLSPIEGVWSELKPASGSYETAYEYYCYGYEHNGDMTFWYGSDKSYVESLVKANLPSGTGYDAKKLRLFIIIEDANRGSEFKPANGGTFEATYVNSDNTSGITTLKNTLFYYKAPLYRQSEVTYKDYQPGDAYTTNCNMTLTAMWEAEKYSVNYNANGGTGAPATQTKTGDVALTLSSTIPTRNGYNFLGWATTPGATAAQYSAGGSYTANADVTLYAVWQKEQASAATAVTVGSTTSLRGKEVLIPISISGNPGVAAVRFKISYDKTRLELTGCDYSSELDWTVNTGDNAGAVLIGTKNYTADGEILWLKFTVLDGAPDGMTQVTVTDLEVYNVDENEIACSVASGGVMVISKISGDVSDDGTVDALDALRLKKYLAGMKVNINSTNADINADGKVSIADLLRLMKYLAGMEVELQ